jgi:hypothetical protein
MIAEEGNYVIKGEADAVMEKGKYIVLWKNYDGAWKMFRDCFNSDDPPVAH